MTYLQFWLGTVGVARQDGAFGQDAVAQRLAFANRRLIASNRG